MMWVKLLFFNVNIHMCNMYGLMFMQFYSCNYLEKNPIFAIFFRSECQLPEHMITDSPERMTEILSAFGTLNSNDTFPLSHSTNTTFTSFYGGHDDVIDTSRQTTYT